jgi:hypothetical protein
MMPNSFNDGAPTLYNQWCDLGFNITPCKDKRPIVQGWPDKKVVRKIWEHNKYIHHQIGLILRGKTDVDIDNPIVRKFIQIYLKSCGAIYGRESNPMSHYLFDGETPYKKYTMPAELAHYMKDYPHGVTLLEIRSGRDKQSIVPGSTIAGEEVVWDKFAGVNPYAGNLEEDISIIVLSAALSILYPITGSRDDYCTAIAGVLSQHTDWDEDNINNFIYNLAVRSGDDEANKRMAKGTNAKNPKTKNFGFPKLAEILGCSVKTVAEIFSWVGVKNSGSLFTELRVYETDPKYWQLKYKDTWITIMDSSILLSYKKVRILILEKCYERGPNLAPRDWEPIVDDLLKNVVKIDAPQEASYYGHIGLVFLNFLDRWKAVDKIHLGTAGTWLNEDDSCYYFRLDGLTAELQRRRISYELRKLTHYLREEHSAIPAKLTINKKEIRCWKVHKDELKKINKQTKGFDEVVRKTMDTHYEKSKNAF